MVQAKENYKAEYLFYINNFKRKFKWKWIREMLLRNVVMTVLQFVV